MPSESYNVGCYLVDRLIEAGCNHVFGVPGDYNLRFLDDIMASDGLQWVGCANELNAAYAADGYARIRRIAAVVTTYGVGELSALNGIGGAYAESNPVLHIVVGPTHEAQSDHLMMHHTLGDGMFQHFSLMSEHISCAFTTLTPQNACVEIDRVINEVLFRRKPGYILLPMDLAIKSFAPPPSKLMRITPALAPDSLAAFTTAIDEKLKTAKNPAVLIGYLCDRFGCNEAAQHMVDDAHMPYAHMLLGKGALNEQSPNYIGCYFGSTCDDSIRLTIENADVCVCVGVKFHDFGTGYFSQKIDDNRVIDIHPLFSRIGTCYYQQLPMEKALEALRTVALKYCDSWPKNHPNPPRIVAAKSAAFCAHHFWNELQDGLKPSDIIVVDQGTSSSACAGLIMPTGCSVIVQCLWGSIGYSVPAAFGAQIAAPDRRVILVVGDGAAQMTAQEFGNFMRHDLHPVLFLVNNDGYVIERIIHGWDAEYNNIAPWNWCALIKSLSTKREPETHLVKETGIVTKIMETTKEHRDKVVFGEVILGRHEMPVVSLSWKPN